MHEQLKGYELRERLGTGGFGAVFRAYQATVGREVAIKVILPRIANHPDFIRSFETEAQIIARLEHLHIVPLYDYWRDPDGAYLVMRWLKGGSLRDALARGPYTLDSTMTLLDQITSALDAAHRNGVIHRDLKPANILLDEDRNAYLADFGIAKDLASAQSNNTDEDTIIGSLDYISPEQARGEPVTPRTDIYALGVVLYETLTGKHPFPNLTSVERLYRHLNDPLPHIQDPALPEAVNAVIQKATAKNPAYRYANALELSAAFREAVAAHLHDASGDLTEVLTLREQEILHLITMGLSNKEIAHELTFTVGTVKWYINQIYKKLRVRSRVQAIVRARELNLITNGSEDQSTAIGVLPIPTEEFQPANPYKGLRAFKAADHDDFFGQEKLLAKLVKRLSETGENSRFLAVVGPSGSGKSSLVKAGLIPAIWRGDIRASERWFVAEMLPGARLLDELEVALFRVAANQASSLKEQLQRDQYGLLRAAQIILPDEDSELAIVIDQFEEVFTLVTDEAARSHFLDLLYAAVIDPRSRVRVIITLRADFYDRPLHYREFGELVRSRMETILPLSAEGLERAILRPAERVGVSFEAGLVASIIQDIHYQPGALPLLQYGLTELFEQRQGRVLTHEAYRSIGGATGALGKRAEQIYIELTPDLREVTRRMFLRLATLGEGVEDTRRRVPYSELLAIAPDTDLMEEVIDTFTAYRLLSLDHDLDMRTPTVEVAHEAILREWDRLRGWLNNSREDIRMQQQLTRLANEWQAAQKDTSFLLQGSRLDQFEKWAQDPQLAFTPDEQSYLQACIARRELEHTAELDRQAREAGLERRSRHFLYSLIVVLVTATAIALGLSVFAFRERGRAEGALANAAQERDNAQRLADESQSLALASGAREAILKNDPDLGLALAVAANAIPHALPQAGATLSEIALAPGTRRVFMGPTSPVMALAISADGRYLLTGSGQSNIISPPVADNSMRLWDLQTGQELRRFEGHTSGVWSVVFSPDGHTAFSGSFDRSVIRWDLTTGAILHRYEEENIPGGWNPVVRLAISADGRSLLIARYDGDIHLIDVETGKERQILRLHIPFDFIYHLSFSPDGQTVFSMGMVPGSRFENVVVWDVASGTERHFEIGDADLRFDGWRLGPVDLAATVSPDGRLAMAARGSDLVLYDVEAGQELRRFDKVHSGYVASVAISQDGRTALTAGDSSVILWDLATGVPIQSFRGQSWVSLAIFTPDGLRAVSGFADGTARLWDLDGGNETRRLNVADFDQLWGLDISPDGRTVLVGALDTTSQRSAVIEWDMATGEIVYRSEEHTGAIRDIAFGPDGQRAMVICDDNTVSLLDTQTGAELRRYNYRAPLGVVFARDGRTAVLNIGNKGQNLDLESGVFSAFYGAGNPLPNVVSDGQNMLLPLDPTYLGLFDITSGQLTGVLEGHQSSPTTAAVSPNGQYALSGGSEPFVILWDVEHHVEIRRFSLPTLGSVNSLVFSADSQLVLAGLSDGLVLLFEVGSGRLLARFEGHYGGVWRVRFSPDSQMAYSTGLDGTLRVWSLPPRSVDDWLSWTLTNRYVRELTESERAYYNLAADQTVAPSSAQYAIPQLSATIAAPIPTATPLVPPTARQSGLRTAHIGDNRGEITLASGQIWTFEGRQGDLVIFSALADHSTSGVYERAQQVEGGLLDTWLVVRGPDGSTLGESDDYLGALDDNARIDLILPRDGGYEVEVRAAHDQTRGSYTLRIATTRIGSERDRYTTVSGGPQSTVAMSPDGQRLLAASAIYPADGSAPTMALELLDISDPEHPMTSLCRHEMMPDEHTNTITVLRFGPGGEMAVSADLDGKLLLWEVNRCTRIGQPWSGHNRVIYAVAFTPDGKQMISGSYDGTARLWDLETTAEIWSVDLGFFVMGAAVTADGTTALFSSTTGAIVEVDVRTGDALQGWSDRDVPYCLALSPDGQVFATGAASGDIILWDVATGQPTRRLRGHTAPVSRVQFSAGGRYLVSGSSDHTVRVWDVSSGEELVRSSHDALVSDVALSPDGRIAVSSSYDGTIRIWDVSQADGDN